MNGAHEEEDSARDNVDTRRKARGERGGGKQRHGGDLIRNEGGSVGIQAPPGLEVSHEAGAAARKLGR